VESCNQTHHGYLSPVRTTLLGDLGRPRRSPKSRECYLVLPSGWRVTTNIHCLLRIVLPAEILLQVIVSNSIWRRHTYRVGWRRFETNKKTADDETTTGSSPCTFILFMIRQGLLRMRFVTCCLIISTYNELSKRVFCSHSLLTRHSCQKLKKDAVLSYLAITHPTASILGLMSENVV
jgi:hypothetical protein